MHHVSEGEVRDGVGVGGEGGKFDDAVKGSVNK